ncbi:hypothetical protein GMLC_04880 [Geomonas limicola]|uniref:ImpA N-terminal domain-containing protein n=1 Tax=Geomonas limicola TaxID=2740186 RepID=A0A6V8N6K3_9BACT|nr:type VI secretion system protein TssA [Geomonas limicola]GFO66909.1 hypothetical protein GMLC_04880 [Geomonas limicola]
MEHELSQLGRHPISPEAPAGTEVREDPLFEALQAEVEKLSAPAAAEPVDWPKVARLSAGLLAEKSKDLLVASYLCVALVHTEGCAGCARGLTCYRELLEHFWEKLYPQKNRLRARVRALEWWVEKTLCALEQLGSVSWSSQVRDGVLDELTRLERLLHDHLETPPSLAPLIDYFCSVQLVTAGESTEQTIPAETERAFQPAALREGAAGREGTPEEVGSIEAAITALSRATFQGWQHNLANPHPYRLRRQLAWSALEDLPPAQKGRTRLAPPPQALLTLLEDLQRSGEPEALLRAAETRLDEYLFWLDLSFYAYRSLQRLGEGYLQAAEAVRQETVFLVRRLPGLEELSFADGTPFARSETAGWLAAGSALAPLTSSSDAPEPALTLQTHAAGEEQVRHLVRSGRLTEAIEQSQRRLKECGCGRERLFWRVTMAGMLMAAGQGRIALPYLDQVLEELDRHHLEEYEPELALRALELAWRAYREQSESQAQEIANTLLLRIGRLDLPEMLRLTHRS